MQKHFTNQYKKNVRLYREFYNEEYVELRKKTKEQRKETKKSAKEGRENQNNNIKRIINKQKCKKTKKQ